MCGGLVWSVEVWGGVSEVVGEDACNVPGLTLRHTAHTDTQATAADVFPFPPASHRLGKYLPFKYE
ncbi:hypothetical protein E2C01_069488 [Portunus trituberculatus]|uniref:Uncharacterized protein n=1 Tax=Portunus trituberculatus TaxID=210409 RepID=A0A5B7HYP4_PORTR|nr:hypothetical protein [Portunus trituberculatus]